MFDFSYETPAFFIDAASSSIGFAANWLLQSTILISIGLLVGWMLRSRGSAVQSLVYRTTLAAVLACPLATIALSVAGFSGWSVSMPVAWESSEPNPPSLEPIVELVTSLPAPTIQTTKPLEMASSDFPEVQSQPLPTRNEFGSGEPISPMQPAEIVVDTNPQPDVAIVSPVPATKSEKVSVATFGIAAIVGAIVWLAFSLFFLTRLGTAWWSLRRLTSRSTSVDKNIIAICESLAKKINVPTPRVLRNPFLPSPCLAGIRRPTILMPAEDGELSIQDLLVHELAHLRRKDCHWNLLRQIATSVLFFQPLIWVLSRRIEVTAEEVCDDFVVQFGGNRADYANQLADIAELSTAPIAAVGVGVVSLRSLLAKRITRILNTSRTLSTRTSKMFIALALTGGIVGTTLTGLLGLGAAVPQQEQANTESTTGVEGETNELAGQQQPGSPLLGETVTVKPTDTSEDKPQVTSDSMISGVVMGVGKKPVAGAKFYWFPSRSYELEATPPKLIATSNANGEFKFKNPTAIDPDAPGPFQPSNYLVVRAPGHGFAEVRLETLLRQARKTDGRVQKVFNATSGIKGAFVGLPPEGNPIRGRVVNIDGNGVAGVEVRIRWHSQPNTHRPASERSIVFAEQSKEQLTRHLESLLRNIEPTQMGLALPSGTTDSQGNFEIKGIGADRLFELSFYGERIEQTTIIACNQPGEKITVPAPEYMKREKPGKTLTIHQQDFLHVAGPSVPVEGQVVDIDTGKPIPNALIRATRLHGDRRPIRYEGLFVTRADDDGKFRITGLPVGNQNELVCLCPDSEAPYPILGFRADTSGDKEVAKATAHMKRGVWVTGRVFDQDTKQPMTGCIYPFYFRNAELEKELPGIRDCGLQWTHWTNLDGKFRLPVLPTHGILAYEHHAATSQARKERRIDNYPRGAGAESIDGIDERMQSFPTMPHYMMKNNYRRLVEFEFDGNEGSVRIDMPLVASRKILVKPDWPPGIRASKYVAYGARRNWGWDSLDTPTFEIKALKTDEHRRVFVYNREHNLVGLTTITPETDSAKPAEVNFQKAGTIVGRLVDIDGEPITDATLAWSWVAPETKGQGIWAPHPGKQANPSAIPTDKDGRFKLTGILPGLKCTATATATRKHGQEMFPTGLGTIFRDVTVTPGEEVDVGDVRPLTKKEEEAAAASKGKVGNEANKVSTNQKPISPAATVSKVSDPTAKSQATTDDLIHGVVVDFNRKPIAGAQFYSIAYRSWEHDPMPPKLVATTDEKGKYSFRKPKLDLPKDAHRNWNYSSMLVVKAPGYGFVTEHSASLLRRIEKAKSPQGWLASTFGGLSGAVITLPNAGNPIKGRIVDIDGQPVDGARVRIQWFTSYGSGFRAGNPNEKRSGNFADDSSEHWKQSIASLTQIIEPQQAIDVFPSATTDSDGRFTLGDIGPNRLFALVVQGKGIETKKIYAYNQPGKKVAETVNPNGPVDYKYTVDPQEFTHVAGPSHAVTGKVIDQDTNRAIPNAIVIATGVHGSNRSLGGLRGLLTTKTDDQGNFKIEGLPVGRSNRLVSFCKYSDAPYPLLGFDTDTSKGPVEKELRMKRGVWAEGQVFDSESKETWTGQINYYHFHNPIFEKETPGVRRGRLQFAYWTNNDGRFRVPVWPTRGMLCYFYNPRNYEEARERPINKYPRGALIGNFDYEKGRGPAAPISNYWLSKEINPDGSERSITVDMPLVASRTQMVKVTWPKDTDIKWYRLYNSNGHRFWNQVDSADVEIKGFSKDEQRELFAFHRKKNLIGTATVDASNPAGTVTEISEFTKAGFIEGQLVDEDGEPIANGIIDAQETRWAFHPGKMASPSRIPTDENGKFRITGLVPGKKYGATVSAPRKYMNQMMEMHIGDAFSGVVVKPGETRDLGTIQIGGEKKTSTSTTNKKNDSKKNSATKTTSS